MFSCFNSIEDFIYEQMLLCDSIVLMSFFLVKMLGSGFAGFPGMLAKGEFDRALVRPRSVIAQILLLRMDFFHNLGNGCY